VRRGRVLSGEHCSPVRKWGEILINKVKRQDVGNGKMDEMDAQEDALRYLKARLILSDLREKLRFGKITWQQYSTLRGQALAGDVDGAVKGLGRVLLRNAEGEA